MTQPRFQGRRDNLPVAVPHNHRVAMVPGAGSVTLRHWANDVGLGEYIFHLIPREPFCRQLRARQLLQ